VPRPSGDAPQSARDRRRGFRARHLWRMCRDACPPALPSIRPESNSFLQAGRVRGLMEAKGRRLKGALPIAQCPDRGIARCPSRKPQGIDPTSDWCKRAGDLLATTAVVTALKAAFQTCACQPENDKRAPEACVAALVEPYCSRPHRHKNFRPMLPFVLDQ
jgi:hypothetical protein